MKTLEPSDAHHLQAAQGWLGLGDWGSAARELDELTPDACLDPTVLQTRFQVYAAAKLWPMAATMARALTVILPENPFPWIDWSYALYEMRRTEEARNVLLSVVDKFPDEYLIRYSLACYACQLGKFAESLQWLGKAVGLAGSDEVRQMVVNNPDLQELWEEMGKG